MQFADIAIDIRQQRIANGRRVEFFDAENDPIGLFLRGNIFILQGDIFILRDVIFIFTGRYFFLYAAIFCLKLF